MRKILTVLGARPQFIKASVVSEIIKQEPSLVEVLVHTGQHFDANMSSIFFAELGIAAPTYYLDIHGGHHGEMTGRMLEGIERVLLSEKPDVVLVYGDTNSTLAGALAAAKLHIPVAHVEAGLRSFNMRMPEEVNRVLTDRVSTWLFTPTADATAHLKCEGTDPSCIYQVGDVMYDVALNHGVRATRREGGALRRFGLIGKDFVLATIHRAENTDNVARLSVIVEAFKAVAQAMPVIWPLHPRTRTILRQQGLLAELSETVSMIEPLSYLDMVQMEQSAAVVATDSGGVQKEAFFYKVPCVTLRDETEWAELVASGWNRLVPPTTTVAVVASAIQAAVGCKGSDIKPYGEGGSARKIVDELL